MTTEILRLLGGLLREVPVGHLHGLVGHALGSAFLRHGGGDDGVVPDGTDFTASGSFTDPNAQQNWSATVNWGDGGATQPLSLNPDKTFNLDHLYLSPGTFTITVTVTDSIGGNGVDTLTASIVPGPRLGTANNDTYIIRRAAAGNMVEFYENRTIAQGPSYVVNYSLLDNFVTLVTGNAGNKTHAAGVVLVSRVVQPLGRGQTMRDGR